MARSSSMFRRRRRREVWVEMGLMGTCDDGRQVGKAGRDSSGIRRWYFWKIGYGIGWNRRRGEAGLGRKGWLIFPCTSSFLCRCWCWW